MRRVNFCSCCVCPPVGFTTLCCCSKCLNTTEPSTELFLSRFSHFCYSVTYQHISMLQAIIRFSYTYINTSESASFGRKRPLYHNFLYSVLADDKRIRGCSLLCIAVRFVLLVCDKKRSLTVSWDLCSLPLSLSLQISC